MCELFGISSQKNYEINQYLKEFFSHSNMHPHGWGLACLDGNEISLEKEPIQATKSNYLKQRLSVSIHVKTAFAHIRYATIGNVDYKNCHPYTRKDITGRRWTIVHNGTIFEFPPLNRYVGVQKGDTDSERILFYIIDQINEATNKAQRILNEEERFRILDSLIVEMSAGNKLNLMLYDGETVYVHTNCAKSLYKLERGKQIIFATVPLSREDWQPVTFTTLMAYRQGQELFQGTNHGNEYIESEENMKFLYQIFADL